MKKQNNGGHINYVVNEEKRTCTAYLEGVRGGLIEMVQKRLVQYSLEDAGESFRDVPSYDNKSFMEAILMGIPDKATVTVRCSPEDEFNPETGCALARVRLLKKMCRYRTVVACAAIYRLEDVSTALIELDSTCYDHMRNYEIEEKAILDSLKGTN